MDLSPRKQVGLLCQDGARVRISQVHLVLYCSVPHPADKWNLQAIHFLLEWLYLGHSDTQKNCAQMFVTHLPHCLLEQPAPSTVPYIQAGYGVACLNA